MTGPNEINKNIEPKYWFNHYNTHIYLHMSYKSTIKTKKQKHS